MYHIPYSIYIMLQYIMLHMLRYSIVQYIIMS